MASTVDPGLQASAQALTVGEPDAQADRSVRADVRELIDKLRRLAPDKPGSRHGPTTGQPGPGRLVTIDGRALRRSLPEPWPRSLVMVVQLLVGASLLAAIVYGPPYYSCKRMKDRGQFFYGETVSACVRDSVSARHDRADAFVRELRSRF